MVEKNILIRRRNAMSETTKTTIDFVWSFITIPLDICNKGSSDILFIRRPDEKPLFWFSGPLKEKTSNELIMTG
jgi:hypothetical protein